MRIQTHDSHVGEHLRMARAGRVAPAAFQRPYAWSREDVLALWDSILLGFPVGFLTAWDVSYSDDLSRPRRDRIGPWRVDPDEKQRLLLIDGQNRLATLAWSLAPEDERPQDLDDMERETWASGHELVIDGSERRIRFAETEEAAKGFRRRTLGRLGWLGVDGSGIRKLVDWFREATDRGVLSDDDVNWVAGVADTFRSTRIPITTIQRATVDDVVHVFRNLNRAGRPVTDQELATALGQTIPAPCRP